MSDDIISPIEPSELNLSGITVIDIDTSYPFESVVHGKQYDTVRVVEAHLYTSGVKWYVPSSNIYSMVSYKKTDNVGGFYDVTENQIIAVTVDGEDRSIIYITLDAQILRVAGIAYAEVIFFDTIRGDRLSSFSFKVDVEEASIREVDLASNPYFNILAEQISEVLEAADSLTGLTATAESIDPGSEPTVEVTGGPGTEFPYNIEFGIPTMPTMIASASGLAPSLPPTATLTYDSINKEYNLELGIPKGDIGESSVITGVVHSYAISTNNTTPPDTGWVSDLDQIPIDSRKGKVLWSKTVNTWSNGNTDTSYIVAYNGLDGAGSVTSVNGRDGAVVIMINDLFTSIGPI